MVQHTHMYLGKNILKGFLRYHFAKIKKKSKSLSEIIAVKVKIRKIGKIFILFSQLANFNSKKLTKLPCAP